MPRKEYWLEDKQFKCAECIPCFEYGKDYCNNCGFDMNIFNTRDDECTDEDPCKDYDECWWCCQHIKPCECGCGYLGGSCENYKSDDEYIPLEIGIAISDFRFECSDDESDGTECSDDECRG